MREHVIWALSGSSAWPRDALVPVPGRAAGILPSPVRRDCAGGQLRLAAATLGGDLLKMPPRDTPAAAATVRNAEVDSIA